MRRKQSRRDLHTVAEEQGLAPEDLMREVAQFRLALDAELSLAAAAVEEGRPDIAAEAVGGASHELAAWTGGMAQPVTVAVPAPRRRRAALAVGPTAVAASLIGVAVGIAVHNHVTSSPPPASPQAAIAPLALFVQADAHYTTLSQAYRAGNLSAVTAAAQNLQGSVSGLVQAAQDGDKDAGQRAAQILLGEGPMIAAAPDSAPLLAGNRQLTTTLQSSLGQTLSDLANGKGLTALPSIVATTPGGIVLKVLPSPVVIPVPGVGAAASPSAPASQSPSPSASPTSPAAAPSPLLPLNLPTGNPLDAVIGKK